MLRMGVSEVFGEVRSIISKGNSFDNNGLKNALRYVRSVDDGNLELDLVKEYLATIFSKRIRDTLGEVFIDYSDLVYLRPFVPPNDEMAIRCISFRGSDKGVFEAFRNDFCGDRFPKVVDLSFCDWMGDVDELDLVLGSKFSERLEKLSFYKSTGYALQAVANSCTLSSLRELTFSFSSILDQAYIVDLSKNRYMENLTSVSFLYCRTVRDKGLSSFGRTKLDSLKCIDIRGNGDGSPVDVSSKTIKKLQSKFEFITKSVS